MKLANLVGRQVQIIFENQKSINFSQSLIKQIKVVMRNGSVRIYPKTIVRMHHFDPVLIIFFKVFHPRSFFSKCIFDTNPSVVRRGRTYSIRM